MSTIALIKIEFDDNKLKVTDPEIGDTYFYEEIALPRYYQIVLHVSPCGVTGVTLKPAISIIGGG